MKINRKQFVSILEAVRPGLADKEIMEQTSAFLFHDGRVYTYNDQIAISHAVPFDIKAVIRSDEIYNLLKRMSDEEITIDVSDKELLIAGRRGKGGVALVSGNSALPIIDAGTKKIEWHKLPEDFSAAIAFVLISAGSEISEAWSTCIHMVNRIAETTDRFRITRCAMMSNLICDVLIPASSCAELIKYKPIEYAFDDQWVHFINKAGTEFSCRTIAGKFPDMEPFINRKTKYKITFHEDTKAILDRVSVFHAGDRDALAQFKLSNNSMTIRSQNNSGWFEEKVRMTYADDPVEFLIKPQFLNDMLDEIREVGMDADKSILKFVGTKFIHCCCVSVPENK